MQETQGDTRFVLKVWSTTKVAYVSIEVLTKSCVSFNPNPPKLPPRPTQCSLSIPTKRRPIQTSRDSTTILESSRATPSHLGDWIPKSNKCYEVIEGEGELLLLESVAHSRELKSSLKNKDQELNLKGALWVFEWPTALGSRWGSIYSPHLKRAIGGIFHRTSLVDLSGSQSQTGQVQLIRLVRWEPLEAGEGSLEADHKPN
jgi:hypothetical protein